MNEIISELIELRNRFESSKEYYLASKIDEIIIKIKEN